MVQADAQQQVAVAAHGLGKCYRIYDSPRARLLQAFRRRRKLYREFWALEDVSFELPRGQTLGVVGRNGSGKSTLLQLLCGTLTPSRGQMRVNGRVGALLELGSGFNPEFSGRENVYLNGVILGLSQREIDARLDDILAFADIGPFIEQPVKTYSSGMTVRLAFAVQAHIDPDILVVDEALAVGDEMFQRKCYNRLERLKQNGTSILLVTHSCPQIIQHCDQALLLHRGRMRLLGEAQRVTTYYQMLANAPDERWDAVLPPLSGKPAAAAGDQPDAIAAEPQAAPQPAESGAASDPDLQPSTTVVHRSFGAEIIDLVVEDEQGRVCNLIPFGSGFRLHFRYRAERSFKALQFGCHVASTSGQRITGAVFPPRAGEGVAVKQGESWEIVFPFRHGLTPGTYFIGGGIWPDDGPGQFIHRVVDFRALKVLEQQRDLLIGLCDLRAGSAEKRKAGTAPPIGPD